MPDPDLTFLTPEHHLNMTLKLEQELSLLSLNIKGCVCVSVRHVLSFHYYKETSHYFEHFNTYIFPGFSKRKRKNRSWLRPRGCVSCTRGSTLTTNTSLGEGEVSPGPSPPARPLLGRWPLVMARRSLWPRPTPRVRRQTGDLRVTRRRRLGRSWAWRATSTDTASTLPRPGTPCRRSAGDNISSHQELPIPQ